MIYITSVLIDIVATRITLNRYLNESIVNYPQAFS